MLEKITKIIDEIMYERNFVENVKSKEKSISDKYPTYKLIYYPRSMDGDSPQLWVRYYTRQYDGEAVGVIDCDMFDSKESMANVVISMMKYCKY